MYNEVTLIGRVGKELELRVLGNNTSVAKFPLATSEKWTDPVTHDRRENVEWHRITVWGKQAELQHKVLKKGSLIHLVGKLKYSSYEKEGMKFYATEIIAKSILWLEKKEDSVTSNNPTNNSNQNNEQSPYSYEQNEDMHDNIDSGDDIPF